MPDVAQEVMNVEVSHAEPSDGVEKDYQPDSEPQSDDPVSVAVEAAVTQYIGFDPAIHASNPDGTPRLRVNGSYALKRGKGGRKSTPVLGSDNGGDLFAQTEPQDNQETINPVPSPATAPQNVPVNSREVAALLVLTCTSVMTKVVGPEWAAEKPEVKSLTDATKLYLDSKGGVQLTPEMALGIAIIGYAAPRMAHENTQSKFSRMLDWCRDRFTVLKARIAR